MTTPKTNSSPGAAARPASAPPPASTGGSKPASGSSGGTAKTPAPAPTSTGGKQAASGAGRPDPSPSSYRGSGAAGGKAGAAALRDGAPAAASAKPDIKDPKVRKEFDDKLATVLHDKDFAGAAGSGDEGAASSSLDAVAKKAQELADEYGVSRRDLIVETARGEIGVGEDGGDNEGERIKQYRAATDGALNSPGPWCNYFTSFLGRVAGSPNGPDGGGEGAVANTKAWAEESGRFIPPDGDPKPGDQVIYSEHIGIVEKVNDDGSLVTIEGNTSDQVMRMDRQRSEVLGFVSVDGGGDSVLDADGGPSGTTAPTSSGGSGTEAPSTASSAPSAPSSSAPAPSTDAPAPSSSSGSSGSASAPAADAAPSSPRSGGGGSTRAMSGANAAPVAAPAPIEEPPVQQYAATAPEAAPSEVVAAPAPAPVATPAPVPSPVATPAVAPIPAPAEQLYLVPQTIWTQTGPVQVMVQMTASQLLQWQSTAAATTVASTPSLAAPTTTEAAAPAGVTPAAAPVASPAPVAAAPAPVAPVAPAAPVDPSITPQAVASTYGAPVAA